MPNQSGSVYGLTILSPIKDEPNIEISHNLALRMFLATLASDGGSPFAKVSSTHLARLVVMDDVVYVGMPACEEHLQAKYLIFESSFDGDLDEYLKRMATEIPETVNAVWQHCEGYPGTQDLGAFRAYMKKCQIETTFFFADVNDKTVQQTLRALRTQKAVAGFIAKHQGKPSETLQKVFGEFAKMLNGLPTPAPAVTRGKELSDEVK